MGFRSGSDAIPVSGTTGRFDSNPRASRKGLCEHGYQGIGAVCAGRAAATRCTRLPTRPGPRQPGRDPQRLPIDLDVGVKAHYATFGPALRRVVGLNA